MYISLWDKKVRVIKKIITGEGITKAFAVDDEGNIYGLVWTTGEVPKDGNVLVTILK